MSETISQELNKSTEAQKEASTAKPDIPHNEVDLDRYLADNGIDKNAKEVIKFKEAYKSILDKTPQGLDTLLAYIFPEKAVQISESKNKNTGTKNPATTPSIENSTSNTPPTSETTPVKPQTTTDWASSQIPSDAKTETSQTEAPASTIPNAADDAAATEWVAVSDTKKGPTQEKTPAKKEKKENSPESITSKQKAIKEFFAKHPTEKVTITEKGKTKQVTYTDVEKLLSDGKWGKITDAFEKKMNEIQNKVSNVVSTDKNINTKTQGPVVIKTQSSSDSNGSTDQNIPSTSPQKVDPYADLRNSPQNMTEEEAKQVVAYHNPNYKPTPRFDNNIPMSMRYNTPSQQQVFRGNWTQVSLNNWGKSGPNIHIANENHWTNIATGNAKAWDVTIDTNN